MPSKTRDGTGAGAVPFVVHGAPSRNRTYNLRIRSPLLYPLSHGRIADNGQSAPIIAVNSREKRVGKRTTPPNRAGLRSFVERVTGIPRPPAANAHFPAALRASDQNASRFHLSVRFPVRRWNENNPAESGRVAKFRGAGDGNRTRVISLEGLSPHKLPASSKIPSDLVSFVSCV